MALSDLVHDVKIGSANFVNRKRWVVGRFGWQEGFGAFSYGHSQLTQNYPVYSEPGTAPCQNDFSRGIPLFSEEIWNRS